MMRKMKILFFIDSLGRGGAQRQMVELARNLDRERFEPVVLIYFDIQQLRKDLDDAGVPVFLIEKKSKFDPIFLIRLVCFFREEKPDILQSYLNTANVWARLAGWLAGIRVIVTSERSGNVGESLIRVFLERFLRRVTTLTISNSEFVKDILVNKIGIAPEQVKVVFNGVDIARFNNASETSISKLKSQFNINDNCFVLTLVGRIAPEKNHQCLIKAMSLLYPIRTKTKVLFVGNEHDIDLKKELISEITTKNLDDIFIFCGPQENMAAVYAISDVVVLPSLWESFPNVIVEAMAAGKPVIASDISDNSKIIKHADTGFIFPNDDAVKLANYIKKIMVDDKENINKMGLAGHAHVCSNFSIEKMTNAFQNLYLKLS